MSFDRIPAELRALPQWVCWRGKKIDGKLTKEPFIPGTNQHASSSDRSTWRSFDEAVANVGHAAPYVVSGIGFVFSENDPYCGIDLDDIKEKDTAKRKVIVDKQKLLYDSCPSYTELSPSKNGAHIIVKASIPTGVHPDGFGIFSQGRFFTFTGDVIRDLPIIDCQSVINDFALKQSVFVRSSPMMAEDKEVCRLLAAIPRFMKLATGNIQFRDKEYPGRPTSPTGEYATWSKADQAIMNIIALHSRNMEQIERIFKTTALYRPGQKGRDYIRNTIKKALDRPPVTPIAHTLVNPLKAALPVPKQPLLVDPGTYLPPPGLLGEIAEYIYQSSPYPSREISLAGAIALMAGICGRQYNVGGTGLNMYVVIVALTGTGKESAVRGMNRLMNEVIKSNPAAAGFMGNGYFASGQALHKKLVDHPHSFVSNLSEFGSKLNIMCSPSASSAEKTLKELMLELFPKSGASDILRGMSYSDKANNVPDVISPAFSFLGDTAPELFYKNFTQSTIMQGLIPRFLTIEHTSWDSGAMRENAHLFAPPQDLVDRLRLLCDYVLKMYHQNQVVPVEPTPEAKEAMIAFEIEARSHMAPGQSSAAREIWSRANMKMRRLAALGTVGTSQFFNPVIVPEAISWSQKIIKADIANIMQRIDDGDTDVTDREIAQFRLIKTAVLDYLKKTYSELNSSNSGTEMMHANSIVPVSFISRKIVQKAPFLNVPHRTPSKVLHAAIQSLVDNGDLKYVASGDEKFTGKCVQVSNTKEFMNNTPEVF